MLLTFCLMKKKVSSLRNIGFEKSFAYAPHGTSPIEVLAVIKLRSLSSSVFLGIGLMEL